MNADDASSGPLGVVPRRTPGTASPGYLDEVLASTARAPQRPWWSSPERWLPVDLTMRRPRRPAIRPRVIALLVLLALLVASIAAYPPSRTRHRLPPPFGLAQNGRGRGRHRRRHLSSRIRRPANAARSSAGRRSTSGRSSPGTGRGSCSCVAARPIAVSRTAAACSWSRMPTGPRSVR